MSSTPGPGSAAMAGNESVVEAELERLRNAVVHLQRSNAELKEAYRLEEQDPEYRVALEENIVVIARYRAKIAALEEELRRLGVGCDVEAPGGQSEVGQSERQQAEGATGAGAEPMQVEGGARSAGAGSDAAGGVWL
jgi:hypothetical protein